MPIRVVGAPSFAQSPVVEVDLNEVIMSLGSPAAQLCIKRGQNEQRVILSVREYPDGRQLVRVYKDRIIKLGLGFDVVEIA